MILHLLKTGTAVSIIFLVMLSAALAQTGYELVLTGGHVIDPANGRNGIMDVAVTDGRIARVAADIPAEGAEQVVDVSGYYVTPGLIDIHGHVFATMDEPGKWLVPDNFYPQSCVSTVVDVGTAGADNFEEFVNIIRQSRTRVYAFLNIASPGKTGAQNKPEFFDVDAVVAMAKKYPDLIRGIKSTSYLPNFEPYNEVQTPWASFDSTLTAGERAGLPVMINFYPRPAEGTYPARSYREFLSKLRPGDIVACTFSGRNPVIGADGRVNPDFLAAKTRGIHFDTAHGTGSFVFRNAVPAIEQGFLPDAVGSDLHGNGRKAAVVDFMTMMSKLMACGMPLEQVVAASTAQPAEILGHPELGTFADGAIADIAVFRELHGDFSYRDTGGGKITSNSRLEAAMTVFGGNIVWDPYGLSAPVWTEIPHDAAYWKNPSIIEY